MRRETRCPLSGREGPRLAGWRLETGLGHQSPASFGASLHVALRLNARIGLDGRQSIHFDWELLPRGDRHSPTIGQVYPRVAITSIALILPEVFCMETDGKNKRIFTTVLGLRSTEYNCSRAEEHLDCTGRRSLLEALDRSGNGIHLRPAQKMSFCGGLGSNGRRTSKISS